MAIIKNLVTGHSFTCRNDRVIEHCRKDVKTFEIEEEQKIQRSKKKKSKESDKESDKETDKETDTAEAAD